MKAIIELDKKLFVADLSQPFDISIPLRSGARNPNAFGIQPPLFEPFKAGSFTGSVLLGGSVNCENLHINAHGNGTHTECAGHITRERITINQSLKTFFSAARLISVSPVDNRITLASVQKILGIPAESVVIRTLPNSEDKLTMQYSGNSPVYLEPALCAWLCDSGVKHLLIDLPSVDAEEDGGLLAAHHAFWNHPASTRRNATITEMIYVNDEIKDGMYLLNMMIASFESDASPSKPVLYALTENK